jgi:CubicO group peptidase (beta-lactamase class C family)
MKSLMALFRTIVATGLLFGTSSFADDLDGVVKSAMTQNHVPGTVVSIVKNCEIAQTRAWGNQTSFGGGPMTPTTRLQAASIGKPVGALAILKTIQTNPTKLNLDQPLGKDATGFGVTPANWAGEVTLRYLLSHQSSLGNSPLPGSRVLSAKPGSMFKYSGVGFRLAQDIVEQKTGKDIEALARDAVFTPFGMTASSYTNTQNVVPGEMAAGGLLWNGSIPALLAAFAVLLGSVLIRRLTKKSWGLGVGQIALAGVGATLAACALYGVFMGPPSLMTIIPLFGAVGLGAWACAALVARKFKSSWILLGASLMGAAIASFGLSFINAPITTKLGGAGGNIAYSLTSTAPDLAKFAIAVMRPTSDADKSATTLMTTPIVTTPKGMKWGVGLGAYEGPNGQINWQWGGNPGYSGLLVLAPARCEAIVVLTNGEKGAPVARAIVKSLWGVDVEWRV